MSAIKQHFKIGSAIDEIITKKDRRYVCHTTIMDNRIKGVDPDKDEEYFTEIDELDKDIARLKASCLIELIELIELNVLVKSL